jgi:hypothetical protein
VKGPGPEGLNALSAARARRFESCPGDSWLGSFWFGHSPVKRSFSQTFIKRLTNINAKFILGQKSAETCSFRIFLMLLAPRLPYCGAIRDSDVI